MSDELPAQIHHNIDTVAQLGEQLAKDTTRHERWMSSLAGALARPRTFYLLLVLIVGWIVLNAALNAYGRSPIDAPPFFWLQGTLAMYAALVTTLVLVRQAGQSRDDARRAHVEFHVNLLAEQKATKAIALLEELRRDLPNVRDRKDSEADALQTCVDPKLVDSALTK